MPYLSITFSRPCRSPASVPAALPLPYFRFDPGLWNDDPRKREVEG